MEDGPLDEFEKSVLLSILGECALALENIKNAKEKEEAAILAKNGRAPRRYAALDFLMI